MYLTDEGLKKIEKIAEEQKDVKLLFLIETYKMLKILLDKQDDTCDGSYNRTNCSKNSNNEN